VCPSWREILPKALAGGSGKSGVRCLDLGEFVGGLARGRSIQGGLRLSECLLRRRHPGTRQPHQPFAFLAPCEGLLLGRTSACLLLTDLPGDIFEILLRPALERSFQRGGRGRRERGYLLSMLLTAAQLVGLDQ